VAKVETRRVFVGYHHHGDQQAYQRFVGDYSDDLEVFSDHSVERAADSDDVEYLARVCRDRIKGTSVTVILVGRQTGGRKFVDWEIMDTLDRDHGLVGILAPGVSDEQAWLPDRLQDNLTSGYAKYYRYPTSAGEVYSIIDEAYQAPASLINNSRAKRRNNSAR
jgi:hypothetical protein